MTKPFIPVRFDGSIEEWCRKLAEALRMIFDGRLDWTTDITLAPNVTSTVFSDLRLRTTSVLSFSPLTANAAASTPWISAVGGGTATVQHDSSAATDRRYRVLIVG